MHMLAVASAYGVVILHICLEWNSVALDKLFCFCIRNSGKLDTVSLTQDEFSCSG